MKHEIIIIFGTRPEWIKLKPIYFLLRKRMWNVRLLFLGQHDLEMMSDLLNYNHTNLCLNNHVSQNSLSLKLGKGMELVSTAVLPLSKKEYMVIVQGDTLSTYIGAMFGFLNQIPVAYIEAGLTTLDITNPFPEEGLRQMILPIASYLFCTTPTSTTYCIKKKLEHQFIYHVGNTIASYSMNRRVYPQPKLILCTLHRRENDIKFLFQQLNRLARTYSSYSFEIPIHPSTAIHISELRATNIQKIRPLSHDQFLARLVRAEFVITDSGGVQEETFLSDKPVLVVRKKTERMDLLAYNGILSPELKEEDFEQLLHKKLDSHNKIDLLGDTVVSSIVNLLEYHLVTENSSKICL